MTRFLWVLNALFVLALSPFILEKTDDTIFFDDFSLVGMPKENILDFLGFIKTDDLEEIAAPLVNPVNMITDTVLIDHVVIDTEAIYYALFIQNEYELDQTLAFYQAQAIANDDLLSSQKLQELQTYFTLNGVSDKSKVLAYLDSTNQYQYNADFFMNLFSVKDEKLVFDLEDSFQRYQTKQIFYYEDFDLEVSLVGVYKESEIIDVDHYYVKSEQCNEFNLFHKIEEDDLSVFLDDLDSNQEYIIEGCHLQLFTHTEKMKQLSVIEEELYLHQKEFVFEYRSNYNRPYLRVTLVFDYWNQEKMLITSKESSFKISKEAHYHRNDFNCEMVVVDDISPCELASEEYPTIGNMLTDELWLANNGNYFHQLGEENYNNVKYLKLNEYYDDYTNTLTKGNLELIYNQNGDLVVQDRITYTYNYGVSVMAHYIKDVIPYLVWGNSEKDRLENSSYERMIWDKDRFTINKGARNLTGVSLIQYFESKASIQNIGTKIPSVIVTNEIDQYYFSLLK